jgi:hypothetical protein
MPRPALSLPSLTLILAALCLLAWRASGEFSLAYVTVDEKTLYIQGRGGSTARSSNELLTLDLTCSWNTSHPPWSSMTFAGIQPQQHQAEGKYMTFSQISQTLSTWDFSVSSAYATTYHLGTGVLEELPGLSKLAMDVGNQFMAAIDPSTDHVYIPGGYSGGLMLDYDLTTKLLTSQPMPMENDGTWTGYTFVWNALRKSFFLMGGQGPSESPYFFEYKPRNAIPWTRLVCIGEMDNVARLSEHPIVIVLFTKYSL